MPRDGGHQERLPGGTGMGQGFEKQTVVVWLRHSGVGITGRQNRRDRTYKNWRGQFGRPWAGHAPDGTASCLLDVSYQRAQCYMSSAKSALLPRPAPPPLFCSWMPALAILPATWESSLASPLPSPAGLLSAYTWAPLQNFSQIIFSRSVVQWSSYDSVTAG